jgi:riboflavin biosynthesis pyrimidine reductase
MASGSKAAARVEARARWMFGPGQAALERGVVHPTSVVRGPNGLLWTLAIDDAAPRSKCDRFSLLLARATADAIVVTGKLLRDEPELSHALVGPEASDLLEWRRAHGRTGPPAVLVLTSGQDLPEGHPLWTRTVPPIVVTSEEGFARLAAIRARGVACVALEHPSLHETIRYARSELGARTVSVEAGASTTARLYASGARVVDELWLSRFHGPTAETQRAAPLGRLEDITDALPHAGPTRHVIEPSGRWSFQRLRAD